jgi:hypothetical protein
LGIICVNLLTEKRLDNEEVAEPNTY